jgi:hypothetical protein
MLFDMVFALLGVQIVSIGFFAEVFSDAGRFDRSGTSLLRVRGLQTKRPDQGAPASRPRS